MSLDDNSLLTAQNVIIGMQSRRREISFVITSSLYCNTVAVSLEITAVKHASSYAQAGVRSSTRQGLTI